ncbi:hypothetical protein AX16_006489 [Volvariella volvacea WC 439]|nr:hypothetical protein AX16_006489 [Volvariella volvacea WC 439]
MRPISLVPSSVALLCLFLAISAYAQDPQDDPPPPSPSPSSSPSSSSSPTSSPSISLSLTTSDVTITTTSRSAGQLTTFETVVPTVFNVTHTISPTESASSSSETESTTSSSTPEPIVLDTRLDPAFGVLGALLILTGLPSAFWGHKNRWTSFFLIGFYSLSLTCFVLIIKFGVLPSINPPSRTLRGMFVLSCGVAGVAGGAVAIFFWKAARYFIGAWGGFALALWIQCFRDGGLIGPIAYRWILYIGCGVIGFVLCTIPKIHYHVLLISTAFVGSSAFMLGVDCFTTAGLKEFYAWNIGFRTLFPKFVNNGIQFPVSQTMQIELGLAGAIALMGIAIQLRILRVLQKKLKEIAEEQKKRDEEAEQQAADRFAHLTREQEEWERDHPSLGKHGRNESGFSTTPLMKEQHDGSPTPTSNEHRSSTFTLVNDGRPRAKSNVSEFLAAPPPEEELDRAARKKNTVALPALDLGLGIQEDVPSNFMSKEDILPSSTALATKDSTPSTLEDLKRKEELIAEIRTIRRSIEALKSETPAPSSSAESRRPSLTSRRTLSMDASALLPVASHLRPPREADPRARVQSMETSGMVRALSVDESTNRPTSIPLRPEDWDAYVQDRKLLQPPAGVTPPIPTTPLPAIVRAPIPHAVTEALQHRKRRESALGYGDAGTDSSEDIPLAKIARQSHQHHQPQPSHSSNNVPVTILPPRKPTPTSPSPQRPTGGRTRTFEELNERHREKLRGLQAPLTQAEKETAELEAAKQRWERAKALEREAVTKRQAEKAAQLEKRKKMEENQERSRRRSRTLGNGQPARHSRSLSADRLAGTTGMSSRRLSTLKVEDWQRRHQQELMKRESPRRSDGIPFPDNGRNREPGVRRNRDIPN